MSEMSPSEMPPVDPNSHQDRDAYADPSQAQAQAQDGPESEVNRRRRRDRYDEWIAAIVALVGIGGLFWWIAGPKIAGLDSLSSWSKGLTTSPTKVRPFGNEDLVAQGDAGIGLGGDNSSDGAGKLGKSGDRAQAPSPTGTPAPTAQESPGSDAASKPKSTLPGGIAGTAAGLAAGGVAGGVAGSAGAQPSTAATPNLNAALKASPSASPTASASASPTPKPTVTGFADVAPNYWAAPFVNALAKRGVIQGLDSQNFKPDEPVNRAQFAAMLQQAFERQPVKPTIAFSDIAPNYWATKSINEAVQTGFMNGYPNGQFLPDRQIPRVEGVVALLTGLGVQNESAEALKAFTDGDQVPKYAKEKIAGALKQGLIVSYPNTQQFNPNQPMTRADAAALIYQALVKDGKAQPVESEFIVKP